MVIMDSLKKGMELMVVFVGLFISFYALLFIGLLVIGVIANTALSGDINVSSQTNTAISNTETTFTSAVDTLQNPVTIIISLVVVGILVSMFFPGGFTGAGKGQGGGVL
jgi:flagellar biosynthesis protein FlhB